MWVSFRHNIAEYFWRVFIRQVSLSQIWKYFSTFLAAIGSLTTVIVVLDLIANNNPEWSEFKNIKDKIEGDWLIYILFLLFIGSLWYAFKRIRVEYKLKNHDVKIIFDYCDVIAGSGHRVIEISNTLCLDCDKIGSTNDLTYFKNKYKKINGSINLGKVLRDSIKEMEAKVEQSGRGLTTVYKLGSLATLEFNEDRYVFATSIRRDQSEKNISTDSDFTQFLAEFWVNVGKQNWNQDTMRIPVFSGAGNYTLNTKQRIYLILLTFIANVKEGGNICKELHICINNDKENSKDLDSFKVLAQYIDEFVTAPIPGGKRIGDVLDVTTDVVEATKNPNP